jgi:hypothetical protein
MRRGVPAVLAALAAALFLTGPVAARDILEDAKARKAVEAQRVEQLVRDAQREAPRLFRSSPAEAAKKLQDALAVLENDTSLEPRRREQLKKGLEILLASYNVAPGNPGTRVIADGRRAEEERRRVEAEQIQRTLSEIQSLRREGRSAEARQMEDDLARRFPNSPSVTAGRITSGRGEALADNRNFNRERNEGLLGTQRSIEKSALVVSEDMTFPKDWAEKYAKRSNAMRITAKEKEILKALNTPFPAEFTDATLQEVIAYLEKISGVTIAVDMQALREAGITYDGSKVTFNVRKATLRSILKRVLGDVGLTYIVKDEAIQVTSVPRARETLSARTYYVGDLVGVTDVRFGPVVSRLQAISQINQIAVLITQTVEPESWMVNGKGGLGTIAFDPITMSLVVRQTAEVHFLMGIGMR